MPAASGRLSAPTQQSRATPALPLVAPPPSRLSWPCLRPATSCSKLVAF
ncbi:unnamed protein product [Musa acuminata subsp. malaccensis]|uniref:(wild Malaysian banana) hypothetical protein n=1 Tax=Musa acuminata subsp. malaccensis TaxID=214687 RepID=A0A804HYG7_MUSAM|nr:unnamed protein product [Musa acuminata subsp. malaccensis]